MRMMPCTLLAIALAGCQPDPAPGAAPGEPAATSSALVPQGSVALTQVGDLVGEYRVAGIDRAELRTDFGIALSIDGPRLSYEPTCAGFVWDVTGEYGAFRFDRVSQYPAPAPGEAPAPVCAVAVAPELRQLGKAIDAAERAWRTPANGVLIEGGGHSVLLFSQ